MRLLRVLSLLAAARLVLPVALLRADAPADTSGHRVTAEEFEAKLGYRSGRIVLKDGLATLAVPASFRFIDHDGAARLLEQAWGNPKGTADDVLGMLVPASTSPLSDEGWGVVITYEEDGYVDDKGAESIDYGKLLKEMQTSAEADNAERRKAGYEPVRLVGWAATPSYDRAAHKLYWAKELAFGTDTTREHTLNYNVRVLGRRGVLVLNAVASMHQLHAIQGDMRQVLGFVEFNEGHRYTDYLPGKDKAAAYGVAGLVAGAVATKAGLFKVLIAGLLAAKKLLVAGFVAAGAWLKRFLGRGDEKSRAPSRES